jgi:hypothetical protein
VSLICSVSIVAAAGAVVILFFSNILFLGKSTVNRFGNRVAEDFGNRGSQDFGDNNPRVFSVGDPSANLSQVDVR